MNLLIAEVTRNGVVAVWGQCGHSRSVRHPLTVRRTRPRDRRGASPIAAVSTLVSRRLSRSLAFVDREGPWNSTVSAVLPQAPNRVSVSPGASIGLGLSTESARHWSSCPARSPWGPKSLSNWSASTLCICSIIPRAALTLCSAPSRVVGSLRRPKFDPCAARFRRAMCGPVYSCPRSTLANAIPGQVLPQPPSSLSLERAIWKNFHHRLP